jgi:hypothetical protein
MKNKRPTKPGQRVKISKRASKWFGEYAFRMNNVAGVLSEENADSYHADRLLGSGYPYQAKTEHFIADCGNGPGFMVEIKFKCGTSMRTILEVKDLTRV